jgi:hypothetical protein
MDAVLNRRFFVSAAVFLSLAIGMQPAGDAARAGLSRRPVHIRKPLWQFNRDVLSGFRFFQDRDPNKKDTQNVDTDEYIEWWFRPKQTGLRRIPYCFFTVCYYTHDPMRPTASLPHTPEVCYRQSGNQVTDIGSFEIPTPGLSPGVDSLSAKYVRMSHPTVPTNKDFCVVYLFCVNGQFHDDRDKARLHLALPWVRAAYFAKIEFAAPITQPDKLQESLRLCAKGLGAAIPELLASHFPTQADIDAAMAD